MKYSWILLAIVMLFSADHALGCSCDFPFPPKSVKQQVRDARSEAGGVFTGKVVSIDAPEGMLYVSVIMEIQSAWKGTKFEKVTVTTGRGGGDCGYRFEVGGIYLVYASKYGEEKFSTGICKRTTPYHAELVDLKYLGKPTSRR